MSRGRPLKPLEVSQGAREELESLVRSRRLVRRAEIVLLCAPGRRSPEGPYQPPDGRHRFRTQGLGPTQAGHMDRNHGA